MTAIKEFKDDREFATKFEENSIPGVIDKWKIKAQSKSKTLNIHDSITY